MDSVVGGLAQGLARDFQAKVARATFYTERVCFERVPAEVNADALARQWSTKFLQSRANMQNPSAVQIAAFEQKKRNFLYHCKTFDTPHFDMEVTYHQFLKLDKEILRSILAQRELLDEEGAPRSW